MLNIRKKGNKKDLEAQLVSLKLENSKLREGLKHTHDVPMLMSHDQFQKRDLHLNSPESYYGSHNRRYEFSTDVSPEDSKHLMSSDYNPMSKRESLELNILGEHASSKNVKVLIHY